MYSIILLLPLLLGISLFVWHRFDWRDAVLLTGTSWAAAIWAITELLSLGNLLNTGTVGLFWIVTTVGLTVWLGWIVRQFLDRVPQKLRPINNPMDTLTADWRYWAALPFLLLIVFLAFLALAGPPNVYDTMTYHMPRILMWADIGSVMHYPTHIIREISQRPFAEYIGLQFFLINLGTGTPDVGANLPQWLGYLGCSLAVSRIVSLLGGSVTAQLLAATATLTLPPAVLQSTNAKNDLVLAFFLSAWTSLTLTWLRHLPAALAPSLSPSHPSTGWYARSLPMGGLKPAAQSWLWGLSAGAALGMTLLTKATAFVFVLPIALWLSALLIKALTSAAPPQTDSQATGTSSSASPAVSQSKLKSKSQGKLSKPAALLIVASSLLLAGLINLPWTVRSIQTFGHPLGQLAETKTEKSEEVHYLNDSFSPINLSSNLLRNSALLLGTGFAPLNDAVVSTVKSLHQTLGWNPDEPTRTFMQETFGINSAFWAQEAFVGNALHTLFFAAAGVTLLWPGKSNPSSIARNGRWMLLCTLVAFALYSLVLRWQPWGTHKLLPILVLGCVVVGLAFDRLITHKSPFQQLLVSSFVMGVMLICALPYAVFNPMRPLSGELSLLRSDRNQLYFPMGGSTGQTLADVAKYVADRKPGNIGLVVGRDDPQYPLQIMLHQLLPGVRIEHIRVPNESAKIPYARGSFEPEIIIEIDLNRQLVDVIVTPLWRPPLTPADR